MAKKKTKARRSKKPKPPPRCKAILFCNSTIIEAGTGNISLIGTFQGFILRGFPGRASPFHIFLQLTDGIGRYDVRIEVHDLENNTVIARVDEGQINLEFPNRLAKVNFIMSVPPLPLGHPGPYDLVVFANDLEIDRQQFEAMAVTTEEQNDGIDSS